ncbi:MAG TPA: TolC family protein [Thermoanaerobaculia bacterium]|nr:TolC family protein [Thermoanaerobaculia bacterium]
MKKLLISMLPLVFASFAIAQEAQAVPDANAIAADGLTLGEAIRIALANNPAAERSRSEVDFAELEVRRARSSIFPQIKVDGRYTRNDRDVTLDFDGTEVSIMPADDWSTSIRLSQPVFAGGRELKAIRQARLAVEGAEHASRGTEEGVLFDVATSFLNVVGAEALVGVEQQNVELATRARKQANDFYEAGEVTRVDVLRAESSIKGAERQLAAARQTREGAASLLRLSLGVDVPIDPESPKLEVPPLPSEQELIALAEANRPEVRRAAITNQIATLEVAKQRGAYLPLITADASFTQQAAAFPTDQYGALTLNFSVPVFTSGEIPARVAGARAQERQAELLLDQSRQVVREDVRRALVGLETARTTLALALEQRDAAEAEYQQIFELYRAQEATSLDLQSAENTLAQARRSIVTATLDRDLAELRVWFATGALKEVLLKEIS